MNLPSPSPASSERHLPAKKWRRLATAFLAAGLMWLLTGCVGILPIPPMSRKLEAGREVKPNEASFIIPGQTTRLEVEQNLGPFSRDCPRAPSLAYSWERPGWKMMYWAVSTGGGGADFFEAGGGWQALFVVFDDQGVVLETKFAHLSNRKSLDDQLEKWAERVRRKKGIQRTAAR